MAKNQARSGNDGMMLARSADARNSAVAAALDTGVISQELLAQQRRELAEKQRESFKKVKMQKVQPRKFQAKFAARNRYADMEEGQDAVVQTDVSEEQINETMEGLKQSLTKLSMTQKFKINQQAIMNRDRKMPIAKIKPANFDVLTPPARQLMERLAKKEENGLLSKATLSFRFNRAKSMLLTFNGIKALPGEMGYDSTDGWFQHVLSEHELDENHGVAVVVIDRPLSPQLARILAAFGPQLNDLKSTYMKAPNGKTYMVMLNSIIVSRYLNAIDSATGKKLEEPLTPMGGEGDMVEMPADKLEHYAGLTEQFKSDSIHYFNPAAFEIIIEPLADLDHNHQPVESTRNFGVARRKDDNGAVGDTRPPFEFTLKAEFEMHTFGLGPN
jgi:hypothetical protein